MEGLPIGRMVPLQAEQPAQPAGACARCACKLSRYRDAWEQHCAPCRRALVAEDKLRVPTFEPDTPTPETLRCHDCDKPLSKRSRSNPDKSGLCRSCLNANKRLRRERRNVCATCQAPVAERTAQNAATLGRPAYCRVCSAKRGARARWHGVAA